MNKVNKYNNDDDKLYRSATTKSYKLLTIQMFLHIQSLHGHHFVVVLVSFLRLFHFKFKEKTELKIP